MYGRLVQRVSAYEGYLGIEPARNGDGTGVAVVYFRDLESINAWAKIQSTKSQSARGARSGTPTT